MLSTFFSFIRGVFESYNYSYVTYGNEIAKLIKNIFDAYMTTLKMEKCVVWSEEEPKCFSIFEDCNVSIELHDMYVFNRYVRVRDTTWRYDINIRVHGGVHYEYGNWVSSVVFLALNSLFGETNNERMNALLSIFAVNISDAVIDMLCEHPIYNASPDTFNVHDIAHADIVYSLVVNYYDTDSKIRGAIGMLLSNILRRYIPKGMDIIIPLIPHGRVEMGSGENITLYISSEKMYIYAKSPSECAEYLVKNLDEIYNAIITQHIPYLKNFVFRFEYLKPHIEYFVENILPTYMIATAKS